MPYFKNSEEEWIYALSDEAERDVIFLWHITGQNLVALHTEGRVANGN